MINITVRRRNFNDRNEPVSVDSLALQVQFGLYSLQLSPCLALREVGQIIVLGSSLQQPERMCSDTCQAERFTIRA